MSDKKQLLKKMVGKSSEKKTLTQPVREFKAPKTLPRTAPLKNKDKKMPILKRKIDKAKKPIWMQEGYEPGSIMRGYTKYA